LLDFLKENNLTIGLIVSSVVLPLMVDFVKRRWDRTREEQERRIHDFRQRQQAILSKRLEITDQVTDSYTRFIIAARFIVLDAEHRRLDSKLGEHHRNMYDEQAQTFLVESAAFPLRVAQYFDRSKAFSKRLYDLHEWSGIGDAAITMLAENSLEWDKPHTVGALEFSPFWP